MEAVDRNTEYEQQAAGGEDQANEKKIYDYDDMYDTMYNWM